MPYLVLTVTQYLNSQNGKKHFASNIAPGANITRENTTIVYYNPANPEEGVLLKLP